jgi:16S rRNA (adenine1518-N6/adenine1519-N6)-dimethyltransferase
VETHRKRNGRRSIASPRPHAGKRFGQHFLETSWADKVVRAIDPRSDQAFVEIGSGRGALTRPLAARAKWVTAFEIDRDLAAALATDAVPKVTVITADFLRADDTALRIGGPTRVAGNLPYNVAAPILFKLVDLWWASAPLVDATLMVQREVADRLLAPAGTKSYGTLTVLIGHVAQVVRLLDLPPGAFRPAPTVRSTLVRLRFHPPIQPVRTRTAFEALVRAAFTWRRKMLANALTRYEQQTGVGPSVDAVLAAAAIDGRRRPETLSIAEFARVADLWPAC